MNSIKPIYLLTGFLVLVLILANIYVSSLYTTTGENLRALEEKKQELIKTNLQLEHEINSLTSINHLYQLSISMGFVEPKEFLTIKPSEFSVASSDFHLDQN